MNAISRSLGFVLIAACLSNGCTGDKTYITNNPPTDQRPPTVEWVSVAGRTDFQSVVSDTVEIVFLARDTSGIDSARLYIDGSLRAAYTTPPPPPPASGGGVEFTFLWNTLSDSDGVHTLVAVAYDKSGNLGTTPAALNLRVSNTTPPPPPDRTPPNIEWLLPRGGGAVQGEITLSVKSVDSAGVSRVWISKNGYAPAEWRFIGSEDSLYSVQWDTRSDSDGVYSLEARAWDEAGNLSVTPALVVNVTNYTPPPEDRTPPRIRWISPAPGSTVRDTITLEFEAADNVGIDSLQLFSSGELAGVLAGQADSHYLVSIDSWRFINGLRVFEIRAYDAAGNVGIGSPVGLTVDNHRVIWVPDDFNTIQAAIEHSTNGDTVRCRRGTYHEGLRLMGKNIWLESEDGPEVTIIDGQQWNDAVTIAWGETTKGTVIRGFRLTGNANGVQLDNGSGLTVLNCILDGSMDDDSDMEGIWGGLYCEVHVLNCVFISCTEGLTNFYIGGFLKNSIILQCGIGYHNYALNLTYFEHDWNLFWQNEQDFRLSEPQRGELFTDPKFENQSFRLEDNSPCRNAGDPEILDRDGSRSDIGLYGGFYAYNEPN